MNDFLGMAIGLLTLLTLVLTIIGLAVRYVLMPYVKEHLIAPVKQVEKQVTENHHTNDEPTVLDRIDDLKDEVRALAHALDGHMAWSEEWVRRVEGEMATLTDRRDEDGRGTD